MPIRLESILILSATILVFNCIMILYDNDAYAQVDNNTLESVAVPAGISEGVAQINTGESPIYIYMVNLTRLKYMWPTLAPTLYL